MGTTRRRLAWIAAALVATGVPGRASAQFEGVSATLAPPPEKYAISPGGVDLRTGRFAHGETDLSIGGDGSAGLTLTRSSIWASLRTTAGSSLAQQRHGR